MKIKSVRLFALCMIVALLCIGAVFQYTDADKTPRYNAVLVDLQINH